MSLAPLFVGVLLYRYTYINAGLVLVILPFFALMYSPLYNSPPNKEVPGSDEESVYKPNDAVHGPLLKKVIEESHR